MAWRAGLFGAGPGGPGQPDDGHRATRAAGVDLRAQPLLAAERENYDFFLGLAEPPRERSPLDPRKRADGLQPQPLERPHRHRRKPQGGDRKRSERGGEVGEAERPHERALALPCPARVRAEPGLDVAVEVGGAERRIGAVVHAGGQARGNVERAADADHQVREIAAHPRAALVGIEGGGPRVARADLEARARLQVMQPRTLEQTRVENRIWTRFQTGR